MCQVVWLSSVPSVQETKNSLCLFIDGLFGCWLSPLFEALFTCLRPFGFGANNRFFLLCPAFAERFQVGHQRQLLWSITLVLVILCLTFSRLPLRERQVKITSIRLLQFSCIPIPHPLSVAEHRDATDINRIVAEMVLDSLPSAINPFDA